jgi:hypothetical protein
MDFKGAQNVSRLALLSSLVYECWERDISESQSKQALQNALGLAKDHYLHAGLENIKYIDSNADMLGVYDEKTPELFIVFRGTEGRIQDIYNDALIILLGKPGFTRMDRAAKFADKLTKEHPNITVTTSGHSLGGALAEYLAQDKKFKCVSFNAAFPLTKYVQNAIGAVIKFIKSWFKSEPKEEKAPNIIGYCIKGDYVSNGPHLGDVINLEAQPGYGAHTIDNFVEMVINYEINTREKNGEPSCDYLEERKKQMKETASGIKKIQTTCANCHEKIEGEYEVIGNKYYHLLCLVSSDVKVDIQYNPNEDEVQMDFKELMQKNLDIKNNEAKMPEEK